MSMQEAKCLDCGKTLSRRADLKRHMNTQHPDGAVSKFQCPFAGCQYQSAQRGNLNVHINSRHSTNGFLCPTCGKGFPDLAARIRHRKKVHGYQPHHTAQYLAKRALKGSEKKRGKAALSRTHDHQTASVSPSSTQNAASSIDSLSNSANATYHNDFWNLLIDAPRLDASELKVPQDVQISVPVSLAPAPDTPRILYSNSDLYLPNVGQQTSTSQKHDVNFFLGHQLDTTAPPQSQTLAPPWPSYGQVPGVTSEYRSFAATIPASGGQSTYPGMNFQSLPAFSFPEVPSVKPNPFNFPTAFTASSSHISGNQFIFPNHTMATPPPRQPVPALSWTPSLSPVDSTPLSQTEFFAGEAKRGFDTWHGFARDL